MSIPVVPGSNTGTWKSIINTIIGLINAAVASRPYVWANAAARLAQTGMTIGEYGYQTDTQVTYRATSSTATVAWNSPWITYTATLTNIAVGTSGSSAQTTRYRYVLGEVEVYWKFTLGTSGASVGTSPQATLPVNAATLAHTNNVYDGIGSINDATGGTYGLVFHATGTSVSAVTMAPWMTAAAIGALSATSPFTWAAGDTLVGRFRYTPA